MNQNKQNQNKRERRHRRIRAKVFGTPERPRLAVYRSNTSIYAELIDDEHGNTIAAADSREVKGKSLMERSVAVGKLVAEKALGKKIKKVVFDRAGFVYTGKVKALADGARKGGLLF